MVKGISLASENAVGMATRIYNRSKYLKLNSYITNKADTVERICVARHQQDTNILPIELGSGNSKTCCSIVVQSVEKKTFTM